MKKQFTMSKKFMDENKENILCSKQLECDEDDTEEIITEEIEDNGEVIDDCTDDDDDIGTIDILRYEVMIDFLEKENKELKLKIQTLEIQIKELEIIRKNQVLIIKNLEAKLLESNCNLEGYYPKSNQ